MKKLGKLVIKPEKLIDDAELVNLKGGYGYAVACKDRDGVTCYDFWADSCYNTMIGEICNFVCGNGAYVCV